MPRFLFLTFLLICTGMQGCHPKPILNTSSLKAVPIAASSPPPAGPPAFVDVAADAGLRYRWRIAGKRPCTILQTIGNGCAFLDYNNDGNLDILLVGVDHIALYQGDGHGHFTEVSHQTGLDRLKGHFLGCAVGDYDNDGFDDIYLTAYRGGALLHNERGLRFTNVTRQAGIAPQPWGTSAAFVDVDGDGRLDLYIGNYVQFGPNTQPQLCVMHQVPTSCGPGQYRAERGALFRNVGGGRFQDVTQAWGFDKVSGKALGVAAAPPDNAGSVEIAIANDQVPGDLMSWHHGAGGNRGVSSGMALFPGGNVYGGMGIDWGDYDNDGKLDLVIATYQQQAKGVFRNLGRSFDLQDTTRLGMLSAAPFVSFGAKWVDFDNDGWLDLMLANGHVEDNVADVDIYNVMSPGATYRQPTLLYRNLEGRRFEDQSARLTGGAQRPLVGRGLAIGDYDNDGRLDALVVDSEGAPLLLHNVTPQAGHWMEIMLEGTQSNRDGYGAVVTVQASHRRLVRHCHSDGSYMSSSDKRVHFGLGTLTKIDRLQIQWPDGHIDTYRNVPVDRMVSIREAATEAR